MKISELNEAHRVASIAWGKFYRNSKVELSKSPKERSDVLQILKQSKEEFDRLIETSPNISEDIILDFKNTFSDTSTKYKKNENENIINEISEKQKKYLELKKPEILGTIETTSNFVYNCDKDITNINNNDNNYDNISNNHDIINNIYNKYYDKNLVYPTTNEILNELDNNIDVSEINFFLKNKKNII